MSVTGLTPEILPDRVEAGQRGERRSRWSGTPFLAAPALIWYTIFMIGPLLAVFVISTLEWGSIISPASFAGLDNYRAMLGSSVFWAALRNTAVQIVILLPVMIPLAFMVGYYLSTKPRGHRVLRVIMFTPGLVSISATAMVFVAILSPTGPVNEFLETIGLAELARPWLASTSTALFSIIAVQLWQGVGYTSVLFAARLESIPAEVYEAARLDGASDWRMVWRVAFPISLDFVGTMAMLQFLWTLFSSAGLILLLTRGGPGVSSTTLSLLVYQKAFQQGELGYSQAVGVVLFAVGLVGMLVIRRTIRARY